MGFSRLGGVPPQQDEPMSQNPTSKSVPCPHWSEPVTTHRNPVPTVDIIIECETLDGERGILLIERADEPGALFFCRCKVKTTR